MIDLRDKVSLQEIRMHATKITSKVEMLFFLLFTYLVNKRKETIFFPYTYKPKFSLPSLFSFLLHSLPPHFYLILRGDKAQYFREGSTPSLLYLC